MRDGVCGPSRQRGVALITVLLVFALVAVIAADMLQRSQLNLRSVGNLIEMRQAYYYALAGEAYARQILAKDIYKERAESRGPIDTFAEDWAQTKDQVPFAIDGGEMHVEIKDLQARFNLNSVVDANGLVNPDGLLQFQRLLRALQLDTRYANEWQDWIDRDQVRSPNGAEDADYPDYRTAGQQESDISALRQLRSMKPEDYVKLAPHVTVLPAVGAINVNTADAFVLRALSPILDSRSAQIIARQQAGGYATVAEFQQLNGLTDSVPAAAVSSSFFEVLVTVNYDNRWQRLRTVLQRINNPGAVTFKVISRARSPLIDDSE